MKELYICLAAIAGVICFGSLFSAVFEAQELGKPKKVESGIRGLLKWLAQTSTSLERGLFVNWKKNRSIRSGVYYGLLSGAFVALFWYLAANAE